MKILVSDTSILVDLERGSLLEATFRLPYRFAVPDILYDRELKCYGGEVLMKLGLTVEELDGDGVKRALTYRKLVPALSVPDSFALALAQTQNWLLLTGDSALRQLAIDEAVKCHGLLWLLDAIHEGDVATLNELHSGLTAISQHPRCRLPKSEIRCILSKYAQSVL